MNTKDRVQLALFIGGLTVSCSLSLFIAHTILTKAIGANVEESLFIISATILFSLPQIIIGMILYYKRKYSRKETKTIRREIKRNPILSFLLSMHIFGVGMLALVFAFLGFQSNWNILWIILLGLVGILSTLWLAKRSWSHNLHKISEWDK